MGMYAGYYQISDTELEHLRQLEERALLCIFRQPHA